MYAHMRAASYPPVPALHQQAAASQASGVPLRPYYAAAAGGEGMALPSAANLAPMQPVTAMPPAGEWPGATPVYAAGAQPHHIPPSSGQPTDWSGGFGYPMKEGDAAAAAASGIAVGPGAATPGSEAAYEYYAFEVYKQQAAAAAAAAASMQQQQQPQQQTAPTYTDAYGNAVDMQSYQAAYAAAVGAQAASYYPPSAYDPAYMSQLGMMTPPVTPQAGGMAYTPTTGMGWQNGMQLASPSRMHAVAQLQKGFGSTGHGAEPGPRERRERHSEDAVDKDPLTYKTEVCRTHLSTGHCDYGGTCQFAHGVVELRSREFDSKYKTELCKNFYLFGPNDEYRVRAGEYEFWLVSPAENLVRVEIVDPRNAQRLEQLTLLVASPPKPPVSPLRPTERTLVQRQYDEEKSKFDVTTALEQLKIEPSDPEVITAESQQQQQPQQPPITEEGKEPEDPADDPDGVQPGEEALLQPQPSSSRQNDLDCDTPTACLSPSAAIRLMRSPTLTRVRLEASLPPSTLPPVAAGFVSESLQRSPRASPSHHAHEERRAKLLELARSRVPHPEESDEPAVLTSVSQLPSVLLPNPPPLFGDQPTEASSISEQKSGMSELESATDPPAMTSAVPNESSNISSPSFERVSQQDVRIQGGDSMEQFGRNGGGATREYRGGRGRPRRGGGGGGGGAWRYDSEVPMYQQAFQPQFSSFAPAMTMQPQYMTQPYGGGPLYDPTGGYVRISNEPVPVDMVGRVQQRRASYPPQHPQHPNQHMYLSQHRSNGNSGAPAESDGCDATVSPSMQSSSLGLAESGVVMPLRRAGSSPLGSVGRVVTISPTVVTSPLHHLSPQQQQHVLALATEANSSPKLFHHQQSQLHNLPIFKRELDETISEASTENADAMIENAVSSQQLQDDAAQPRLHEPEIQAVEQPDIEAKTDA